MTTENTQAFAATERNGRIGIWIDGWTALAVVGAVVAIKILDAIIAALPG
jgi:hypothetical protein